MVEKNTFSVTLFIKKTKLLKNGQAPILLRITVKGIRTEISAGMSVEPDHWDSGRGKFKTGVKDAQDNNNFLNNLITKVQVHKRELADKGIDLTTENLKDAYLGKMEENRGIMDIFQEHNDKCQELSGKDFAPGTVERYITARKHIGQFIWQKYRRKDILASSINNRFIKDFEHFLKTERNCNHNTSIKYLKNFKKITRICLDNDWIKSDPFKGIQYRLEAVDVEYLDREELDKIRNKQFTIKRLEQVRDVFVFCCFTGLAFIDVKSLNENHIVKDFKGRKWIKKKRQKTGKLSSIPLLEVPLAILKKYENDLLCIDSGKLLPVSSNQKMNAYLKEIADICGIKKKLATHSARHTFATTVTLSNNISLEAVSEMLGHSSLKMTKRYARVVDDFLGREMDKLENKFSGIQTATKELLKDIHCN